jgi:membrane dipeptidase
MKRLSPFFAIMILLINGICFAQAKPDGKKAWEIVNYLASDEFKGRKSGTPEYQKAAEYVALKMKEYGLQPGGENGTYFQQVPFKNWRNYEQPIRLEITAPRQRVYYAGRRRDFQPTRGTGSGAVKGQLVFAGYGISSKKHKWDDYENLDVEGKIVMIVPGVPESKEKELEREWTINKKIETAVSKGAVGVIRMDIFSFMEMRQRRISSTIKKGACPEGFVVLTANQNFLDDVFYLGKKSWRYFVSKMIREKKSFNATLDVTVEMEAHYTEEDREAPNVIGILPGKDTKLKDEYIIIGGHLDHLGVGMDGFIYNGADDNAGSAGVILEIARVLKANKFRPDRTLVFASWAGEELGLIGSRYYTRKPVYPLEKTVVYMNMDMVGCGDTDLYVGGMWEFSDFYDILKENMSEEMKKRLRYRLNYRGSDHSSFLGKGVTSISLRTGNVLTRTLDEEHPEYHTPGDDPNIIEPELLELSAQYYYDILVFLANCRKNLLDPIHHINFVHKDSIVVDLHCDTIGRYLRGADLSKDNQRGHIDIPKLKKGAMDLQVFACFVAPPGDELQKNQAAKRAFQQIEGLYRLVDGNPDDLAFVKSYEDLMRLRGSGKTGVLIGIEGGYAIESDLSLLRTFYILGVRLMTLTHWTRTDWADASGDEHAELCGLTEFGEKVVKEMNRLGMIIDVSHVHDETFWDVIRITDSPVVASHSCCRALSDHHRNLSDEMLKALAKNGGVIGINYAPGFLNAEQSGKFDALREEIAKKYGLPTDYRELRNADPEKRKKFFAEYQQKSKELSETLPPIDVKTVVDHIDHVVKVTGKADYVGLGSDYDGIGSTPVGLEHVGKIPNITKELFARGYKEADIRKILGGNFLRVMNKVFSKSKK